MGVSSFGFQRDEHITDNMLKQLSSSTATAVVSASGIANYISKSNTIRKINIAF